jgi:hypothetical protein
MVGTLAGPRAAHAQNVSDDPVAAFSALLTLYVSEHADSINRVNYAGWKANASDMGRLNGVVTGLERMAPSRMARAEAIAYWANLYNAITLQVVLSRYPVASIRDIRSEGVMLDPQAFLGPWRSKRVTVERRRLSLDDIEHQTLRPLARDARVHYSVNCASIGCPNIQRTAWRAETLEQDLDRAARAYVNHPRAVTVLADGTLRVSSIYEWFKEDFGGNDLGVIAHLRRYAEPALTQQLRAATRISSNAYDWALNTTP